MPAITSAGKTNLTAPNINPGRKLSVLLVCRSYPPVIGGSEIEAQRVCSGLIRRGHTVEVVCCGGDPMPNVRRWVDPYGVPVRMYGTGPGRGNDHRYGWGVIWTMLQGRRRFDVIYFLMAGVQVAYGVPLARALGIPSVMKFSGSNDLRDALRSAIGPMEVAAIRKWCETTMILNDAMVDEAVKAGFDRNQLLWMPNPVDTDQYRPVTSDEKLRLRTRLGIPPDVPVVVFVGRLAPEKEIPSLISAFALAAARHDSVRLVVVGDGVMRPELEQQVDSLGIRDRITFAGMQKPEEICRWLQASDIFALVSRREGLPVSLIEAMAVALPSVVTDIPANTQLVEDGRHGYHAKVTDAESIASGILRLCNDPESRNRFGAAARPIAMERFSIDRVLDAYEDLFGRIVAQRAGTA
jgi:glycosyltransferase involved in cell wall biosynthesis